MAGIARFLTALLLTCGLAMPAMAGVLTATDLANRFPPPYIVGPKEADLPVWPVFKQNATVTELVGYAFESADMAPIPGFAGVPMNLLVTIDPKGTFIDVAVLSQHEPVFIDGLGEAPLLQFVKQYKGLALSQNISIDSKARRERAPDAAHAYLDGVSKATASVRILNQSAISSALKVARKKLGFAQGRDPDQIGRIDPARFDRLAPGDMLEQGLIAHLTLTNKDVDEHFAGSAGEGLDPADPQGLFIDLYLAWVSVPSIGRNLLSPESWSKLSSRLEPGDHALLVMSSGRYSIQGDDFVRGSVPDRIVLRQDGLPIDMRDLDTNPRLADPNPLGADSIAIFRVIAQAGLDPARAVDFSLPITRKKGGIYPERITREIGFKYRLSDRYVIAAESADKTWRGTWKDRRVEIGILLVALALLAAALARQRWLVRHGRRFDWIRRGFLLFTIVFVGYFAQGQLSIVNVTAVVQSLMAGRSLGFLLFDPMTIVMWLFVLVSLLLWGRGTFCGWLCPFGALQEFTGKLGQWLKLPQWRMHTRLDGRFKWIKYVLLGLILASAVLRPSLTDALVELEPFKTAITLNFKRSLPYVLYAGGLLVMSMFSYKFYCRYICPFGAALAVLGRLRRLDWIVRRAECGTPCQTCRHRCEYHAITPLGEIAYEECFQCMDCVVIYDSDDKCAPRIMEIKRRRTVPITRYG